MRKNRGPGDFLLYCAAVIPYKGIPLLPHGGIRPLAAMAAYGFHLFGGGKLVRANIRTAMPELPEKEVRRIEKESLFHLAFNMLEFLWMDGRPERIRRCCELPAEVSAMLSRHTEQGERIIFVNPHLGSWEASGIAAPFYAGIPLAAIAKPIRNDYLNRLFNRGNREKVAGLKIIFSHGAIRAALKALKEGLSIGTLVDQNTRVRDGGIFLRFFGLPVAGSPAPAVLKRYCDAHGIPAVIIYGVSLRNKEGKTVAEARELSKPFAEYADDREVMQELMGISEEYIRKYPEQYLWMYRRFQYIPPDCPEELRKRYPYYAVVPEESFFRKHLPSP